MAKQTGTWALLSLPTGLPVFLPRSTLALGAQVIAEKEMSTCR